MVKVREALELRVRMGSRWEQLQVACAKVLIHVYDDPEHDVAEKARFVYRSAPEAVPSSSPLGLRLHGDMGGASNSRVARLKLTMLETLVAVQPPASAALHPNSSPLCMCIIHSNDMPRQTMFAATLHGDGAKQFQQSLGPRTTPVDQSRPAFPYNILAARRSQLITDPHTELMRAEAMLANRSWLKLVVVR